MNGHRERIFDESNQRLLGEFTMDDGVVVTVTEPIEPLEMPSLDGVRVFARRFDHSLIEWLGKDEIVDLLIVGEEVAGVRTNNPKVRDLRVERLRAAALAGGGEEISVVDGWFWSDE